MEQRLFIENNYIDFHTHFYSEVDEVTAIVSLHLDESISAKYYTVGIHPWYANSWDNQQEETLRNKLSHENCLALGEVGLDRLKGVSLEFQKEVLIQQLKIANELNKAVVIHCVKAFDELLQIHKQFPEITKWCIHGFNKNIQLAKQLMDRDFYLSLSPANFKGKEDLLKQLPRNKIFLETDDKKDISIENIYLHAASVLEISVDALKQQISNNAEIFFGYGQLAGTDGIVNR